MNAGRRAAMHFRDSRALHGYAKGKTAWDPAYPEVAARLCGGGLPVLDIGCGVGLLAAYLRESGCRQPILGIEPDEKKVQMARKLIAPAYENLEFAVGDACMLPEFSGEVVILDVLHYLDDSVQQEVLQSAALRVAPGGRIFIRTTFKDSSWRYYATLMEEVFVRASGWIRGGRCRFPTAQEIRAPFEKLGWEIQISPMWGKTPFNSHLMEVVRPR